MKMIKRRKSYDNFIYKCYSIWPGMQEKLEPLNKTEKI